MLPSVKELDKFDCTHMTYNLFQVKVCPACRTCFDTIIGIKFKHFEKFLQHKFQLKSAPKLEDDKFT